VQRSSGIPFSTQPSARRRTWATVCGSTANGSEEGTDQCGTAEEEE